MHSHSPINVLCKMKLTRRSCWSTIWLPIPQAFLGCSFKLCFLRMCPYDPRVEPSIWSHPHHASGLVGVGRKPMVSFLSLHVANGLLFSLPTSCLSPGLPYMMQMCDAGQAQSQGLGNRTQQHSIHGWQLTAHAVYLVISLVSCPDK